MARHSNSKVTDACGQYRLVIGQQLEPVAIYAGSSVFAKGVIGVNRIRYCV